MSPTNDSSSSAEHALGLADNAGCLLCCLQSSDRSVFLATPYSCVGQLIIHIERVASSAFEIVTRVNTDHFAAIVRYGAFADLTVCITEFCKVSKYQKISLLAIAMLRGVIPVMLSCPECSLSSDATPPASPTEDNMIKYWFPVLFGFYDIIMNGEDLEVRRLLVVQSWPTTMSLISFVLQCT